MNACYSKWRTNFPFRGGQDGLGGSAYQLAGTNIEVFQSITFYKQKDINLAPQINYFNPNTIKYILGDINYSNQTQANAEALNSTNLEEVSLRSLNISPNFSKSSKLSRYSILKMISYETATSAITITLHPTAYAMAMADAEIQTALTNHPLVSLVEATNE